MIYYYEKYHKWVAVTRWKLQKMPVKSSLGRRVDSAVEIPIAEDEMSEMINPVQYLGKRSQFLYQRNLPLGFLDWILIPVAGFMFYILPQIHAQISHLWTDSLEYKVAAKPQANRPCSVVMENSPLLDDEILSNSSGFEIKLEATESKSTVSTKGDEGFCEEFESDTSSHIHEFADRSPMRTVFSV
jgi:hypothetical protein